MWSARNAEDAGTAKRRRERRLRQFLRHERPTVAILLAESTHHAAQRGQRMARAGGWVRGALHGRVPEAPTPQEPGTQHFSLDDDSVPGLGGSRPDRLHEVRPQEQVLRHTVEQLGDVAPGLPAVDVLVPQMVDKLEDVLKIVDLFVPELEIEVPKISSLPSPPFRRVFPVPQTAEQLVEVPTEPVYVLMVLASKVFSRREVQQRLGPSRSLTILFLRVGGGVVEIFKVYALDRIQQQRTWSRPLIFLLVAVFKVSPRARDLAVDIPVVAQMQIPLVLQRDSPVAVH